MHRGFIKLFRKIDDWCWSKYPDTGWLFIYLLLKANHKDKCWNDILIKRGQLITSRKSMVKATGVTDRKYRTSIKRLISTNDIEVETTSTYSLITVRNYEHYQSLNTEERPGKRPAYRPTSDQPATTNNNVKNVEEEKERNIISFDSCFEMYNKHGNKTKALKNWNLLSEEDQEAVEKNIPDYMSYIESTSTYQKDFENYLKPEDRCWEQEYNIPEAKEPKWYDDIRPEEVSFL